MPNKCIVSVAGLIIGLIPLVSIFLVGRYFPPSSTSYQPIFQPPGWVFAVVWTYVTLALGGVSVQALRHVDSSWVIAIFYSLFLLTLNGWLVVNYYQYYKEGFYLLISTCFLAIIYQMYLGWKRVPSSFLLLPFPFWLVIASCLNATIYDHYSLNRL